LHSKLSSSAYNYISRIPDRTWLRVTDIISLDWSNSFKTAAIRVQCVPFILNYINYAAWKGRHLHDELPNVWKEAAIISFKQKIKLSLKSISSSLCHEEVWESGDILHLS
jgi:hypothetical protein